MRMKKAMAVLALLLFLDAIAVASWYWSYLHAPSLQREKVRVSIPKGKGVRQIGRILADAGVLQDDLRYLILVRFSGLAAQLKAGEYVFTPGLTPPQVLRQLAQGGNLARFTVPEGLKLEEIAAILSQGAWADNATFLELARNPRFIHSLGLRTESLEGYLFPDTYFMVREDAGAEKILRLMTQRFNQVWAKLPRPSPSNFSQHEIVTLASIVEKETGQATERPLIARVFLNRLSQGMRLQSDPTVIYGMGKSYKGNLSKADLSNPHRYNTYMLPGLPPAPICNPGQAALEAVLRPAQSTALYFVSKNDGSHVFSMNLHDHNQAVRLYQGSPKSSKK